MNEHNRTPWSFPGTDGGGKGSALLPTLGVSYVALAAEFGPALLAHSRPAEAQWERHALRSIHGSFL